MLATAAKTGRREDVDGELMARHYFLPLLGKDLLTAFPTPPSHMHSELISGFVHSISMYEYEAHSSEQKGRSLFLHRASSQWNGWVGEMH